MNSGPVKTEARPHTVAGTAWVQQRLRSAHILIFVAMLSVLYLILLEPRGSATLRSLFVLHLGLFMLWQPIIEGQSQLAPKMLIVAGLAVLGATLALDGWLLMLWIMLLAGVVGGRVLLAGSARLRIAYLLALMFLVTALLLLAVPMAVRSARVPAAFQTLAQIGLPLLLLGIVLLPRGAMVKTGTEVVDLINSIFVFLLLAVLVLGSLSVMLLFNLDYAQSLLQTLFTLGAVLLVLGWVWSPHAGFGGIQNVFARYLLSIGLPAQHWLQALADLTQVEDDPERFLKVACTELIQRLDWIRGIDWSVSGDETMVGRVGAMDQVITRFDQQGLVIQVSTSFALPPSVVWHLNLLTQLLAEFFADKQRANRLRELSYMRAVHETGARLTHDVKNLLQSLQTLIYAAEQTEREGGADFRELIRRQLPTISMRLATTLDKLRVPQSEGERLVHPVHEWWDKLRQRYAGEAWIQFDSSGSEDGQHIPSALFSAVADNLLANVAEKRLRETDLSARVQLRVSTDGVAFSIGDNGAPVPENVMRNLLRHPVASTTGLGIGLYQVGRHAEQLGYRLALANNQPGNVCFELAPKIR